VRSPAVWRAGTAGACSNTPPSVTALAERTGAGLIPLHESTPRQRPLFTDPIHMSASGNRVKAELIAKALAPSLDRAGE